MILALGHLTIDSILHTIYDLTDPFKEIVSISLCKARCKMPDEAKSLQEEFSRRFTSNAKPYLITEALLQQQKKNSIGSKCRLLKLLGP